MGVFVVSLQASKSAIEGGCIALFRDLRAWSWRKPLAVEIVCNQVGSVRSDPHG